ncbi:MAG: hypothetical protein KIT68_02105 [Phycisphaeraceae bacterium]|nr:hypothetical protein [Phycisphaeraceae bacterium]
MSQALTRYQSLFDSVRSRARRPEALRGLDKLAATAAMRLRNRRVTPAWLRRQAELIDALGPAMRGHSEAALADRLATRVDRGRADEATVRGALAAVREAARRETGQEAFVVQLMGALALYHGRIVEMLTGEGKTLTGSLAAPLIAWRHRHLHVFTVNDYLAARDASSRAGIYRRCGLSVGSIQQEQDPGTRAGIYARPIVYGTPKQIVADWLRDQLRLGPIRSAWAGRPLLAGDGAPAALVPGLRAALVDEADAVLIDEGVVPLIIARSRKADEQGQMYKDAAALAARLVQRQDFTIDAVRRTATLTARGRERLGPMFDDLADPIWRARRRAEELVRQALSAAYCYANGRQYQVVDGRVQIVDEYTGRILPDRNWEHGLHQAIEAKEGVEVTADRETMARLSFQRFFKSYPFLAGMTGTAADATAEMERTYQRRVLVIPTNRPIARRALPTRIFRSAEARWAAAADAVEAMHKAGRPVLAGTRSIEASEILSRRLWAKGLTHKVLNANFDKDEAEIISRAGLGAGTGHGPAITVATNMAGRGTDIELDDAARAAGGLHVILTEMHGAKRIDRQFIGRAGRQGDPGSCQLLLSLEDELVRLNAPRGAAVLRAMARAEELRGRLLHAARALMRLAQRRSERRDRASRAQVLKQDEWVDKHIPGM